MMAILTLSGSVGPALSRIAIFNIQMQEAKVAFNRMEEFTELDPENEKGELLDTFNSLNVDNMSFNYPGSLDLLSNINMIVEKGQITSLLGESGPGKSTILQLVQQFYTPLSGQITIGEKDLTSYNLTSFRHSIGVVPQEITIFNNYLIFNIALTDDPKKAEGVIEWCKIHGFDKYFEKFRQGYMTLLGEEGVNISGGERQLVGLARALYKSPQLLLIDEGTSSMDRETEKFVMRLLQKIKKETAILMVTHRLQTALESDVVYLLEDGGIVDSGSPRNLIKGENFFGKSFSELLSIN